MRRKDRGKARPREPEEGINEKARNEVERILIRLKYITCLSSESRTL